MPAILNPAARRINADVAGLTHVGGEPNPGAPVAATPTEILHEVVPTEHGGLAHLFSDGLIPSPTEIVSTDLVQPTGSLLGRLGGLVPRTTSSQAPGPGTQIAPPTTEGWLPNPVSGIGGWDPGGQLMQPAPPGSIISGLINPGPVTAPPNGAAGGAPVQNIPPGPTSRPIFRDYVARARKWLGL